AEGGLAVLYLGRLHLRNRLFRLGGLRPLLGQERLLVDPPIRKHNLTGQLAGGSDPPNAPGGIRQGFRRPLKGNPDPWIQMQWGRQSIILGLAGRWRPDLVDERGPTHHEKHGDDKENQEVLVLHIGYRPLASGLCSWPRSRFMLSTAAWNKNRSPGIGYR